MFGDGFEQSTLFRTGPRRADARHHARLVGRARVGARRGGEAELFVFRRWEEFHREALGYRPSWGT
jgi:hypothetical protein